jgi:tRNA threonylcarbamoyladenosine biosynthesis protein TsaB
MRVLALDTTTRAGSVAVVEDDRVVIERAGDPTCTHAERLPGEILNVLSAVGLALPAVEVFAVAAGPGSFTGLRVGIATVQGLAFVRHRRVVPVSALEATAEAASGALRAGARVGVWIDAYRREVFSALYEVTAAPAFGQGRLIEVAAPSVGDPASILERWSAGPPVDLFVGEGAVVYRGLIGDRSSVAGAPVLAGTIGRIAVARARLGETLAPAAVHPLYVRRPDAEIDREKKRVLGR